MSIKTNLLYDKSLVKTFCEEVIPNLKKDEVLTMYLSARKKYGYVSHSHEVLDKIILKNTNSDYIFRKIKNMVNAKELYR